MTINKSQQNKFNKIKLLLPCRLIVRIDGSDKLLNIRDCRLKIMSLDLLRYV